MQPARRILQTRGLSSAVQESELLERMHACQPFFAGTHVACSCAAQQWLYGRAGTAAGLLGATRRPTFFGWELI